MNGVPCVESEGVPSLSKLHLPTCTNRSPTSAIMLGPGSFATNRHMRNHSHSQTHQSVRFMHTSRHYSNVYIPVIHVLRIVPLYLAVFT